MIRVNPASNPHLSQYTEVPFIKEFHDEDRILYPNARSMPYSYEKVERSAMHWGQRKLLLSEIEFLTNFTHKAKTLVYVGAGSRAIKGISLGGVHVGYLSRLFPEIDFHLYDPTDFGVEETDHIHLYNQLFLDDDAKEWKNKNIPLLYVSDIRTVGDDEPDKEKYAEAILRDMNNQLNWSQIMNPNVSMVKFKLPYGDVTSVQKQTKYPRGDNYLPVWGRQTTTETRLVYSDPNDLIDYDNLKHEEQMSYFNNVTLLSYYDNEYKDEFAIEGFDNCYSCRSEIFILENYIRKIYGPKLSSNKDFLMRQVKKLSESITHFLTNGQRSLFEQYEFGRKQHIKFNKAVKFTSINGAYSFWNNIRTIKRLIKQSNPKKQYEVNNILERFVISDLNKTSGAIKKMSSELRDKQVKIPFKEVLDAYNSLNDIDIQENPTLENRNQDTIIKLREFEYTVPTKRFNLLKDIWHKNNQGTEEKFLEDITICALNVSSLIFNGGQQWSIPSDVYKIYMDTHDSVVEAFASPFNSKIIDIDHSAHYCSLFEIDRKFGSLGNFFQLPLDKYNNIIINPPFVESIILDTFTYIDNSDINALFIVPAWKDAEFYRALSEKTTKNIELHTNTYKYEFRGEKILARFNSTVFIIGDNLTDNVINSLKNAFM